VTPSVVPSSSDSMGLGKWGDSGVTSESWVWVESMEDDGSRSGQGFWREARYVTLSIRLVGLSHGPSCDRTQLCAVQRGGQFIVMQLDDETGGCSLTTCTVVEHGE